MTRMFRLRPIMRQGTAASIPEAWIRYAARTRRHWDDLWHGREAFDIIRT